MVIKSRFSADGQSETIKLECKKSPRDEMAFLVNSGLRIKDLVLLPPSFSYFSIVINKCYLQKTTVHTKIQVWTVIII